MSVICRQEGVAQQLMVTASALSICSSACLWCLCAGIIQETISGACIWQAESGGSVPLLWDRSRLDHGSVQSRRQGLSKPPAQPVGAGGPAPLPLGKVILF